jgi:hypothetical protein
MPELLALAVLAALCGWLLWANVMRESPNDAPAGWLDWVNFVGAIIGVAVLLAGAWAFGGMNEAFP